MLACNAQYFGRCELGYVFDKCTSDLKTKDLYEFDFDLKEGFDQYVGSSKDTKYHEAAWDAYMTGFVFPVVIKYKELAVAA